MTTVNANQVALGIESFGDNDAPLVLLAGGTTMLSCPRRFASASPAGAASCATTHAFSSVIH